MEQVEADLKMTFFRVAYLHLAVTLAKTIFELAIEYIFESANVCLPLNTSSNLLTYALYDVAVTVFLLD